MSDVSFKSPDTRRRPLAVERRTCLRMLASMPVLTLLPGAGAALAQVGAAPEALTRPLSDAAAAAIEAVLQGRTALPGRVTLKVPKLAENGLSVPLEIQVESPMTAADHVTTLHLFAPVNPIPTVARVHLGPRSGAAALRTRVRLADTQSILAFAEMSDGQVFSAAAHVIVTLGGCVDPVL